MRSLQSEVEQRGRHILGLVDKHPESLFSKAGFYQRLMTLSMRDEQLKLQLFRFVDVLPSLRTSGEIVEFRNFWGPVSVWPEWFLGSAGPSCGGTFPKWRASSSPAEIRTM
jgi:hypothetical protein